MRLVVGSAALATAAGFAQAQSVAVNSPTETVLYSLKGGIDGAGPRAGLIFDANGALYGTTCEGGTAGYGTVFKLTPPTAGKTQWTETVLHRFPGGSDGASVRRPDLRQQRRALRHNRGRRDFGPPGTVFKLTPPGPGQSRGTETVLYRFKGPPSMGNLVCRSWPRRISLP